MAFLVRRLLGLIAVLVLTWTIVFAVLQIIPGDPVNLMLDGAPASEAVRENLRHQLGLDQPVLSQYIHFLRRAADGDLGDSYRARQPVTALIAEQLPATLQLAAGGLASGLLLGLVTGLIAGIRANTWADTLCMTVALVGLSLPSFWIGMMLVYVFGIVLAWAPITGSGIAALILPSITVGLFIAGGFARLIRASVIDAMAQDYIRTARAKGLSGLRVLLKHALRNALIPPLTLLGMQFALLIGGAVVTENVFARPGIGSMLVQAVLNKDTPLVQALVVYTTAAYVLINFLVDLLYGLIDPRVRLA